MKNIQTNDCKIALPLNYRGPGPPKTPIPCGYIKESYLHRQQFPVELYSFGLFDTVIDVYNKSGKVHFMFI